MYIHRYRPAWFIFFLYPHEHVLRSTLDATDITSSYMYPLNVTNSVAQEPKGASQHSQQLTTGPYSEPTESNPQPAPPHQPISWKSILIPSSNLCLGLPSRLFPLGFLTKTLYTVLSHACYIPCPPHLPWLMLFGDEYKLWSTSLFNFFHTH
jgi:hypothetical protein